MPAPPFRQEKAPAKCMVQCSGMVSLGGLSFFFARFFRRGVCPFCDEIRERSSFNDSCCVEVQVEWLQLDVPSCDMIGSVGIAQDLL